jgi:hypothetical protein
MSLAVMPFAIDHGVNACVQASANQRQRRL